MGPSVVASSDLLGPGECPDFMLDPDKLRQIEERDPQDKVKLFLALQKMEPPQPGSPFEELEDSCIPVELKLPDNTPAPLTHLQSLPRLQIPRIANSNQSNMSPGPIMSRDDMFSPESACRTATATPVGAHLYRFGTPASEMDVPVTQIPVGPVARDASQSVPPNMHFRDPVQRSSSRAADWRRPSLQLPSLAEDMVYQAPRVRDSSSSGTDSQVSGSPGSSSNSNTGTRVITNGSQTSIADIYDPRFPDVMHSGWMKKRKTRLLRHEWNEHHFRLTNKAQLTMHRNDIPGSSPLDTLNIDEYSVACSSLASNKLSAKLKSLTIQSTKDSSMAAKDTAFSFQLVPSRQSSEEGKLKKMTKAKETHHFAVKTRDERIDWMRELMLAKAMRDREANGYDIVEVIRGEKTQTEAKP